MNSTMTIEEALGDDREIEMGISMTYTHFTEPLPEEIEEIGAQMVADLIHEALDSDDEDEFVMVDVRVNGDQVVTVAFAGDSSFHVIYTFIDEDAEYRTIASKMDVEALSDEEVEVMAEEFRMSHE